MNFETWIKENFYWLHENPELAYNEFQTTKKLREILTAEKIKILDLPLKTGLVAKIGDGSPKVALRCDIDALPIEEKTSLPYKSKNVGKMHACGHDFHTASVLGAAKILNEKNLRDGVFLIFQPAEEAPGGALKILETGILNSVEKIIGLHSSPFLEVGKIGIRAGFVTAAVDKFEVTFEGKSTHAAQPERGTNPIFPAAQFVSAVQTILTQNINSASANLISITHILGGNTWNVTPANVFLEGTVRSFAADERAKIKNRMNSLAQNISAAFDCTAKIIWTEGPPATFNDSALAEFAKTCAKDLKIIEVPISMVGEDFAYYTKKIRGVFVWIGTGISTALHSPTFEINPAALLPTAEYLARLCKKFSNEKE